jgi:hypothetical protein
MKDCIQKIHRSLTFFLCTFVFLFIPGAFANASSVSALPVVFDIQAKARDILRESITIKNTTNHKQSFYAFVNNVTGGESGGVERFLDWSSADKTTSLANWISVSRAAIELAPLEERKIEITIEVNLDARPGRYHAAVSFAPGSNRDEANGAIQNGATVMINVDVAENVVEFMQLRRFVSEKTFYGGSQAAFLYDVENIGNRPLSPRGEVIIYDRKGKEVGSVPVNADSSIIAPGETKQLAVNWKGSGGFGRYKAYLNVSYGGSRPTNLTDAAFFFIFPWKIIMALFGVLALFVSVGAYWWHARYVGSGVPVVASVTQREAAMSSEKSTISTERELVYQRPTVSLSRMKSTSIKHPTASHIGVVNLKRNSHKNK